MTVNPSRRSVIGRRAILLGAGAAGVALVLGRPNETAAALRQTTPTQPAGPFYARLKPLSIDNDLAQLDPSRPLAEGRLLYLSGRVLDTSGRPLAGTRVEIWQANTHGRYNHPRHAHSMAKPDPHFQGFGHDQVGSDGVYGFRTIKPGAYGEGDWRRPPHIHFLVVPPGGGGLTTQMYFAGEVLNRNDFLLGSLGRKGRVLERPISAAGPGKEPDAGAVSFDIVLGRDGSLRPVD